MTGIKCRNCGICLLDEDHWEWKNEFNQPELGCETCVHFWWMARDLQEEKFIRKRRPKTVSVKTRKRTAGSEPVRVEW